jgi:hypothetical protein
MAFVDIGVGTAMLYGAGIGAAAGGIYAGVTGKNVLNGALLGGAGGALLGGGAAGIAGASWGGAGAEMIAADVASMSASGLSQTQIAATLQQSYGMTAAEAAAAAGGSASSTAGTALQAAGAANTANSMTGPAPTTAAGSTPVNIPTPQVEPPVSGIIPAEGGDIQTLNGQTVYPNTGATTPTFNNTPTPDQLKSLQAGGPQAGPAGGGGISGMFGSIGNFVKEHPYLTAAGAGAAYLATRPNAFKPNYLPAYKPQTAESMGLGARLSPNYRPYFAAAQGGIASLDKNFSAGGMYPGSQIDHTQYATSPQTPMSMQATMASYDPETNPLTGEPTTHMAAGGMTAAGITGLQQAKPQSSQPITMDYIQSLASQHGIQLPTANAAKGGVMGQQYDLGGYSDGGRLLKGPGDGMSDNIPASIANKQPARLADGEFVVPADVVSHLGNGSTDAGAKHLYKMMDNVRKARTGRKAQGKQIKADKYLPK